MKQINANVISDELAEYLSENFEEDNWKTTNLLIADAYQFIVYLMTEDASQCVENIDNWTNLLSLVSEYKKLLDDLHKESKISPRTY